LQTAEYRPSTQRPTDDLTTVTVEMSIDLARRSLRVAGKDPYVIANAARTFGLFGEDIATAIASVDRSLQLNPSFARGWRRSGTLRLWAGQYDLAIEHFETSIRLSRLDYGQIGISTRDREAPPGDYACSDTDCRTLAVERAK
jgi:hypothetical protein